LKFGQPKKGGLQLLNLVYPKNTKKEDTTMRKSTKTTPELSIVNKGEIDISTSVGVVLADIVKHGKSCLDALSREMGAIGVDSEGDKRVLGLWQGSS